MDTTTDVRIIKGAAGGPDGKWEEVQEAQHEPFIFIQTNGSRWRGEDPGDVAELLDVLGKYKLRDDGFAYYEPDPCRGVENPDWYFGSDAEKWIDGPRMYAEDGVFRFHGNFDELSHAFCIDTNHKPTIDALVSAIENNRRKFA